MTASSPPTARSTRPPSARPPTARVIRRMPNLVKFREDPDAMLVMSLEDYDEVTGKAAKAAIMQQGRGRQDAAHHARSAAPRKGLLVSLDQRGAVDLPFIATLYGKPEEQIIAELGDLIFHDPESKTWQTADAYLSGNVRAKLAAAEQAGPAYARNAEALARRAAGGRAARRHRRQSRRPVDSGERHPGVRRRPLRRVAPSAIRVGHLKKDAVWSVDADYAAEQSVAATSEYGTPRANGTWLLELALNMKTPVIYDTIHARRPRGARRQPGGDARRPREAEAHQGAVPLLGLRRSRSHRAARAALQRHLQQPAAPALRRLAPRLPRHEPDDHAAARTRRTPSGAA